GRAVGIGDEVRRPLDRNLQILDFAEIARQRPPGLERRRDHDVEKRRTGYEPQLCVRVWRYLAQNALRFKPDAAVGAPPPCGGGSETGLGPSPGPSSSRRGDAVGIEGAARRRGAYGASFRPAWSTTPMLPPPAPWPLRPRCRPPSAACSARTVRVPRRR